MSTYSVFVPLLPLASGLTVIGSLSSLYVRRMNIVSTESSILVATRSHVLPYPPTNTSNDHYNAMDMSMPLDFNQSTSEPTRSDDPCGEDAILNLTEIRLKFNGVLMSTCDWTRNPLMLIPYADISTLPLEPLSTTNAGLSSLNFVCQPPTESGGKGSMCLLANFLDFGDCTCASQAKTVSLNLLPDSSTPHSTLTCHPFSRTEENGTLTWVRRQTTFSIYCLTGRH